MIRIGRIKNSNDRHLNNYVDSDGCRFEPIVVMTKSSKYGALSPYLLKDNQGRFMENAYQFAKIYPKVPKSTQCYSQWDRTVIWDHPEEVHLTNGEPNEAYFKWRHKGMHNPYPVRYPVGLKHRSKCIGAIKDDAIKEDSFKDGTLEDNLIDYLTSRKEIYMPCYMNLVRKEPLYARLLSFLEKGKNLIILEVDGPHVDSLQKMDLSDDETLLASPFNLKAILKDTSHNFGHGYCLAWALYEDFHKVMLTC